METKQAVEVQDTNTSETKSSNNDHPLNNNTETGAFEVKNDIKSEPFKNTQEDVSEPFNNTQEGVSEPSSKLFSREEYANKQFWNDR